jgi:general secretion pathway protein J
MKRILASHARGFTLLEIILALSLTAMLLSMLTAGVYGVVRDWDNNAERLEQDLEQTIAILQLERALQGAFPHSHRDLRTLARHVFFAGAGDELSWVSTVSPQRGDGLTAWRLYSTREGTYLQLAPALSDDPSERLQDAPARLLFAAYRAEFQYLYEDLQFQRRWRSDWPGAVFNILPLAVHVRLIPIDGDVANSLDIVAPLMAIEHRSIRPNLELIR